MKLTPCSKLVTEKTILKITFTTFPPKNDQMEYKICIVQTIFLFNIVGKMLFLVLVVFFNCIGSFYSWCDISVKIKFNPVHRRNLNVVNHMACLYLSICLGRALLHGFMGVKEWHHWVWIFKKFLKQMLRQIVTLVWVVILNWTSLYCNTY